MLGRWKRLQPQPYKVTGLLCAQHGLGRGSGNNTTSDNWQEQTQGPFQPHKHPAPLLLHLGAEWTDPVGDGDCLAAFIGVLHDRHEPMHHIPIPCCAKEATLKNSWVEEAGPQAQWLWQLVLSGSGAGQSAHVQCKAGGELLTSPLPAPWPQCLSACSRAFSGSKD